MTINKMHWRGMARESLDGLLARFDPTVPRSAEELSWENVAPVGAEFGSPDFERLLRESSKDENGRKPKAPQV
jgi:hypothetical protein